MLFDEGKRPQSDPVDSLVTIGFRERPTVYHEGARTQQILQCFNQHRLARQRQASNDKVAAVD